MGVCSGGLEQLLGITCHEDDRVFALDEQMLAIVVNDELSGLGV